MTGAKIYFVRGCSFVLSYLGILFLLANRQLNITKRPQNLFVYPENFICAQIRPSAWRFYLRADKFICVQINLSLCRRGTLLVGGSCSIDPLPPQHIPPPSLCGSQGRCLPPLLRIPWRHSIFYRIFCPPLTLGKGFDSISPLIWLILEGIAVVRRLMADTTTIPARSLSRAVWAAAAAAAAVVASSAVLIATIEGRVYCCQVGTGVSSGPV